MIDNQKQRGPRVNQFGVSLNHPNRRCHKCKDFKSMIAPIGKATLQRAGKWYCADCAAEIRKKMAV